ncbi:MAG TPA: methyltransferase domain-containing protein [Chthoniobacterales bacterium]|nr:methyltransferase domain-containing protein [Chthoniobacterales bacterium]
MKRRFDPAVPELMDRPQPVTGELDRDLANIRSLNRWFGSYRQVRYFLHRWLKPNDKARVLDVSTGSGDIPRLIVDFARKGNIPVQIDAIDQQASTIEIARGLSNDYPEIEFFCSNLFAWNPSELYDIVLCSLTLHHFSEDDAVDVLKKCREFTREHVLVADLRRSLWLTVGVYLVTATVYHEAMTKTDARLSAARAFSFAELRELALRAGWKNFGHRKFPVGRQVIWL